MCHLLDYFVRNKSRYRHLRVRTLLHMHGVSYACRDDLCLDIMESEDLCNSVDEIDTRLGDIIETSYERTHKLRLLWLQEVPGLAGEDRGTFTLMPSEESTFFVAF